MARVAFAWILVGLLYAAGYCLIKKETRPGVLLAVVTGWPIFLFSLIGSGWNALLSQQDRKRQDEDKIELPYPAPKPPR